MGFVYDLKRRRNGVFLGFFFVLQAGRHALHEGPRVIRHRGPKTMARLESG